MAEKESSSKTHTNAFLSIRLAYRHSDLLQEYSPNTDVAAFRSHQHGLHELSTITRNLSRLGYSLRFHFVDGRERRSVVYDDMETGNFVLIWITAKQYLGTNPNFMS